MSITSTLIKICYIHYIENKRKEVCKRIVKPFLNYVIKRPILVMNILFPSLDCIPRITNIPKCNRSYSKVQKTDDVLNHHIEVYQSHSDAFNITFFGNITIPFSHIRNCIDFPVHYFYIACKKLFKSAFFLSIRNFLMNMH